jgi:acyl-CoA thioester hydrolase
MTHRFDLRVYYEDTDLAGIVYYANYLRYIERARSEWVRGLGIDQVAMRAAGQVFAVRHVAADYLMPARFDDMLQVQTSVHTTSRVRLILRQDVLRGDDLLFSALVTLVCMTLDGAPIRLPAGFGPKIG